MAMTKRKPYLSHGFAVSGEKQEIIRNGCSVPPLALTNQWVALIFYRFA